MQPDFRVYRRHQAQRVRYTGTRLGNGPYWRLFAAENTLRIVIHSILSIEVGPDWWFQAVAPRMRANASRIAAGADAPARYVLPGPHGLYFLFLTDLAELMRANAHLLRLVPNVDGLIEAIEKVRRPRNAIAHMNHPSGRQLKRIDRFYADVISLEALVGAAGIVLRVPRA